MNEMNNNSAAYANLQRIAEVLRAGVRPSQNFIAKPVVLLSINISILVLECSDMPVITNIVLAMIKVLATTVTNFLYVYSKAAKPAPLWINWSVF